MGRFWRPGVEAQETSAVSLAVFGWPSSTFSTYSLQTKALDTPVSGTCVEMWRLMTTTKRMQSLRISLLSWCMDKITLTRQQTKCKGMKYHHRCFSSHILCAALCCYMLRDAWQGDAHWLTSSHLLLRLDAGTKQHVTYCTCCCCVSGAVHKK